MTIDISHHLGIFANQRHRHWQGPNQYDSSTTGIYGHCMAAFCCISLALGCDLLYLLRHNLYKYIHINMDHAICNAILDTPLIEFKLFQWKGADQLDSAVLMLEPPMYC